MPIAPAQERFPVVAEVRKIPSIPMAKLGEIRRLMDLYGVSIGPPAHGYNQQDLNPDGTHFLYILVHKGTSKWEEFQEAADRFLRA